MPDNNNITKIKLSLCIYILLYIIIFSFISCIPSSDTSPPRSLLPVSMTEWGEILSHFISGLFQSNFIFLI